MHDVFFLELVDFESAVLRDFNTYFKLELTFSPLPPLFFLAVVLLGVPVLVRLKQDRERTCTSPS